MHLPGRDGSHGSLEPHQQLAATIACWPAVGCALVAAELRGLEGGRRRRLLHGARVQRLPIARLELQLQRLALQQVSCARASSQSSIAWLLTIGCATAALSM
jgi:hypothetical protein